ncbi:hypothetical protein [Cupriavidus sp. RAF12]|uniref:hypothetical protein n=1 Tax=Cupriavidus sp. RAF12 TaxID=3233050 RepID=UPI003F93389A
MKIEFRQAPLQLDWAEIRSDAAVAWHSAEVEIGGWMIPLDPGSNAADYFVLAASEPCCGSCPPCDPLTSLEVFASGNVALHAGPLRLRGRLLRLQDDPADWRYRLEGAELAQEPGTITTSTLEPTCVSCLGGCARPRCMRTRTFRRPRRAARRRVGAVARVRRCRDN